MGVLWIMQKSHKDLNIHNKLKHHFPTEPCNTTYQDFCIVSKHVPAQTGSRNTVKCSYQNLTIIFNDPMSAEKRLHG